MSARGGREGDRGGQSRRAREAGEAETSESWGASALVEVEVEVVHGHGCCHNRWSKGLDAEASTGAGVGAGLLVVCLRCGPLRRWLGSLTSRGELMDSWGSWQRVVQSAAHRVRAGGGAGGRGPGVGAGVRGRMGPIMGVWGSTTQVVVPCPSPPPAPSVALSLASPALSPGNCSAACLPIPPTGAEQ